MPIMKTLTALRQAKLPLSHHAMNALQNMKTPKSLQKMTLIKG